jgi:hypothetical protein
MVHKKPEEDSPEVATPYHVAVLILLWIFILVWIAPLASFAAPVRNAGFVENGRDCVRTILVTR